MDRRLQLRVQRYGWDRAAPHYETYWGDQLRPAQDRLLELAGLGSGERILELACGTGLVTFRAAGAVGPEGELVATDISDEMVARIEGEVERRGLENVTAERMDAEALGFDDGSFDVVLCALGLMYAPDPVTSLTEMRRVLVDGGRAVVAVWGARSNCGWADIFPIMDERVKTEVCPLFFQLGTGTSLEKAMETAGFQDVETDRISTTLEYDSEEDAVGAAFLGGPVAMAYSRFDDATRDEVHAEYLESIAEFRVDGGYRIPGEFVVAKAEKTGRA